MPVRSFVALGAVLLMLAGCGRQDAGTPAGQPGQPKDYRAMLEHARQRQAANSSLKTVTEALQKFQVDLGRSPKDLSELVRARYLKEIPPPPEGQTYYYDPPLANVELGPVPKQPAAAP